jgi:outer membrane receptor protein involved in Fe transport
VAIDRCRHPALCRIADDHPAHAGTAFAGDHAGHAAPGNFAASRGNPDLKPFKSSNLDFSAEYYYAPGSYISIGAYLKSVNNFIVLNQTTGTVANASGTPLLDPPAGRPRSSR